MNWLLEKWHDQSERSNTFRGEGEIFMNKRRSFSRAKAREDLRKLKSFLEKRKTGLGVDDFWFNGKLWSEMTEEEREQTRNYITGAKR
jgi:hypothetical protein